jgi:two-component system chemotaxis response regulator CheB
VLLVDDSKIALTVLKKILSRSTEIQIVGTAGNGEEGLKAVLNLKPDVICSDYHMPIMDGLEFTQQVMRLCPTPILILSIAVQSDQQENVFQLLDAGAVDVLPKPCLDADLNNPLLEQQLISKIRLLSGVRVFTRKPQRPVAQKSQTFLTPTAEVGRNTIIVIGASTGGPQALETIFTKLPGDYPFTIICIQHISAGFLESFISWLNKKIKLPVSIAKAGELPQKQHIYFAPDDANLIINSMGRFELQHQAGQTFFPNIDATFFSISKYFTSKAIGVLLTGMGSDGAQGLKAISEGGGLTVAQDEASCTVFGMPKVAIELGAAKKVLSLEKIAQFLSSLA